MRTIPVVLAAAFLAAAAQAAAPGTSPAAKPSLPATVTADLKSVADMCREVGGKPQTGNAVKRVDLNGDGHEDFVLDVAAINCDGAVGVYGDREKGVTVYAGDGKGGASLAFSDQVFGVSIEGSGPAAKLWLTVSGGGCGKKPARDFASENFCDRSVVWNAKTLKFDYARVATVRMIR